jgi:hypothetical protein
MNQFVNKTQNHNNIIGLWTINKIIKAKIGNTCINKTHPKKQKHNTNHKNME